MCDELSAFEGRAFDSLMVDSVGSDCSRAKGSTPLLDRMIPAQQEDKFTHNDTPTAGIIKRVVDESDEARLVISPTNSTQSQTKDMFGLHMLSQAQTDRGASHSEVDLREADLSEAEQTKDGDQELYDDSGALCHTKYELRPQSNGDKLGFITWMDEDKTGDYDPAEERRQLMKRKLRPRPKIKAQDPPSSASCSEGSNEDNVIVPATLKLIVKLNVLDKQRLEAFVRPPDLWTENTSSSRRLRKRGPQTALDEDSTVYHADLDDQHSRVGHYHGHPAARGCRQCLELHDRCSLLDDEQGWPCTECRSESTKCELIVVPRFKGPCDRCTKRRLTCAYTFTVDHSGPCADCTVSGSKCTAGPVICTMRPRIRYDTGILAEFVSTFCPTGLDAAILPTQKEFNPKLIYTCKRCDQASRQCSFVCNAEDEVCTACEMGGKICVKRPLTGPLKRPPQIQRANDQAPRLTSEDVTKRPASISTFPSTPTKRQKFTLPSGQVAERMTKQITTKLSHPISFNHSAAGISASQGSPCHFCSPMHLAYPLLGIGHPRIVSVYDEPTQAGLIELKPSPHERTRMCLSCTNARLSIVICSSHNLHLIPGISAANLDFEGALSNLFAPAHRVDTTRRDRWCSICLNLAICECLSPHGPGERQTRCALALCLTCVTEFESERYRGELQVLLAELREGPSEKRPLGLRADWALLKTDGLLVRFIRWNLSQGSQAKGG